MYRIEKRPENLIIIHMGTDNIGSDVRLDARGKLIIGDWSWISDGCWIETHTHDFDVDDWPINEKTHTLTIGSQVYIAPRAIVLGRCRNIADGVLIAMGAVVTHDITEPWTVWAGNPARKIRDRKQVNATW